MAKVEDQVVHVGDEVGFKEDYEDSGTIVKIKGQWLDIEVYDSNTCDTSIVTKHQDNCWIE